ncbi:EH domain-binding protein 1-like [Acropora millepora]|uniref:EH domain-binding protein 1-like n=1 Tax=Acropora millepora TaxID=45264 RepID=UPI001CF4E534|nr:EH domain-binding protein 1-like [Acropora millepora]
MSSVWKRLQRVGKKASKFQFSASYQSLSVECVRGGKWLPNKLVVVWTRRKRRKAIKAMTWQPNIGNPFRGIIVWPEPEPVEITVTLYKDSKPDSAFEDKEWTFVIEDESQTGRRKPIATGVINMIDYVSTESRSFDITLTLKVASKKLVSATLDISLSCVLIKEGMATDDDMISIGSMMSLNDTGGFNLDDEDDMEVAPSPSPRRHRNLSSTNLKSSPVAKLKDQTDSKTAKTGSPGVSPILAKDRRRDRVRSRSALGENVKTIVSEAQKRQEAAKRLSTGSDVSSEISDSSQDASKDKSKMEAELIKWTRTRTKGYRGVKVKDMTKSWRDGLAFCAILHSYHPELVDFSSLDPNNIKDNCKLAFSEFDKLGIPRLLDPTQMMFSPVPDKLSVMTYVYQIKNRFAQQQVAQPSPLNLRKPVPRSRPAPPPPVASKEVPVDSRENKSSVGSAKEKDDRKDAFNPFLEELEDAEKDVNLESRDQSTTAPSDDTKDQKSGKKELDSESSNASPEINNVLETSSKDLDTNETGPSKPPRKPPRKVSGPDHSVEDVKTKASGPVSEKGKVESKEGYNPFDEEEETEAAASPKGNVAVPLKTKKPPAGYNPFDEEETYDSQEKDTSVKERKVGYNPFDEDGEDKEETRQKKVSYPHSFNPFEGEDDVKSKDDKKLNESSSKAYNPFDDENDDSHIMNDASTPVKNSTRKSSVENKTKAVAQAGSASPSRALKQPATNVKKRQAPPPPAVKSSDDPWTRLPDETMIRRRRSMRRSIRGGTDQSPNTSPARSGPKRTAPTPPRRPPLIPTFDEWKNDRGVAGDNERPADTPSVENLPNETVSSETEDKTRDTSSPTPDKDVSRSPKVSSGEAANQADIKLLARQVLLDARKKAGASGALPRERVAEIKKTSKGSPTSDGGTQDKEKTDDPETLKKRENLRLRKEELQRKKKANEKTQKLAQNAVNKEMGEKLASSSEQLTTRKQSLEPPAETTEDNSDQKTVKNKNLQHRPLKLKDKENEPNQRKLSTEKDGNTSPGNTGFQESEELQRIREVLNQGKKKKIPNNCKNIEQENGKVNHQKPETSTEKNVFGNKSTKNVAVNGISNNSSPGSPSRPKLRAPNAGIRAYVESRKMNFEAFEVSADQSAGQENGQETSSRALDMVDGHPENSIETSDADESQTMELQDTSEYVRQELKSLEEQQEALDKVGEKLEIELRRAMGVKGCEEEQEKLMQDWFLLVNKKNELVRKQAELNLLKNEEDLERSHDMLQRELRALLEMEDCQKTDEQREREAELIEQLVSVVNKRDQLVQFEDSQLQQAEKDALHVQKVIADARIPRDKGDCVLQ